MELREIFPGVYLYGDLLLTRNLVPGQRVYGEKLLKIGGEEYRAWDPYRSKLAGAIKKGMRTLHIRPGSKVLYLGAAEGTTASHVSDIVGKEGIVYCVDVSPRVMPKLLSVAEKRDNMIPILADARKPEEYRELVVTGVDVIYQDVAQPDQAEILLKNAEVYGPSFAHMAVKARSIDVTADPEEVFKKERKIVERFFSVEEIVYLDPYDKDHAMFVMRRA